MRWADRHCWNGCIHESAEGLPYAFVPPNPPEKSQVPGNRRIGIPTRCVLSLRKRTKTGIRRSPGFGELKEVPGARPAKGDDPEEPAQNLFQEDQSHPDIFVFNDADQGFRDLPGVWPKGVDNPPPDAWMLLRLAGLSVAEIPDLWKHIFKKFGQRLVVVTTVNDLRQSGKQISRGLSWERTAEDVRHEVPNIRVSKHCAHFVVFVPGEGAIVSNRGGTTQTTLYYDPKSIEGLWSVEAVPENVWSTHCVSLPGSRSK